jgi:hypothetical protein
VAAEPAEGLSSPVRQRPAAAGAVPVAPAVSAESTESDRLAGSTRQASVKARREADVEASDVGETVALEESAITSVPPEGTDEAEESPASSRRPVVAQADEALARLAFGAEEPRPPLHTPPPESGRLPAALPVDYSAEPGALAEEPPSAAPPQGRESAVGLASPREEAEQLESSAGLRAAARQMPELSPQKVGGRLEANPHVAEVIREAAAFSPPTFLALVEASLAL